MLHVACSMLHVLCFMSHALCFMFHVVLVLLFVLGYFWGRSGYQSPSCMGHDWK